jgi:PmbA protein
VPDGNGSDAAAVDLAAVAARVAGSAQRGEQIEAYVVRSRDTEIKVFGGEVESVSVAGIEGVGVRVIVDGRQGYAWAGSLTDDVVDATVHEARDNAGFGTADEHAGLLGASDVAALGRAPASLDLWREELLSVPTERKVALTLELERAALALDPRIRGVESADYGDTVVASAIASSLGVAASSRRTVASCAVSTMAGEGAETRTGYGFSAGRAFSELDTAEAAAMAVERTVRILGARKIPSRRLPVILDPLVTASLLGLYGAALNGEAIIKGRSMFAGREGESVAAPHITLVDDPSEPRAFGATPYDAEGVPTARTVLVQDGVLCGFLHNVYTGRRSGAGTTGSAVRGGFKSAPGVGARALRLDPGDRSLEQLFADVGEGLYVQSMSGLHSGTNTVSGDISVGAVGLMVRDGAFAEPVREVTIASTLQRMLLDLTVGADEVWLPGAAVGVPVVVAEMSLSGS